MKVLIATFSIMWSLSLVEAANRTDTFGIGAFGTGHPLSLEKIARVMRTEVSGILDDTPNPAQGWNDLIQAETARILEAPEVPSGLRRSVRLRTDAVAPFVVCEVESGVSGQVRKQVVSKSLKTDSLMNLYNKDDMSCFALRSKFSDIQELPQTFETIPILPEMKIPHGTMDAIAHSDVPFERVEAILCPGSSDDLKHLIQEIEERVKGSSNHAGRKLRVHNFLTSRSGGDLGNSHPWHRSLTGSGEMKCQDMFSEAMVDSFGDTIMFAFRAVSQSEEWRVCLKELILDLALHEEVCFVGAYQSLQLLNDLASGIVQSGSPNEKPLYDVGLDGTGQVVALSDSGIDVDNCYFFDSEQETPKTAVGKTKGPVNPLARKVIQYVSFADDSDYNSGHGTHVAGSIAGRRSENGRDEQPGNGDGVARNAKLAFFDIGPSNNGLTVPLIYNVLITGYEDAGARIHSASWGGPNQNSYTSFDHNVDSFMYDRPDFLFIVAAGNAGRDRTFQSIASPGLNKNGITVGASQNSSPHINSGMRGPDFLAEFSSRGPSQDGRIKPDIVAPGFYIESARANPNSKGECDNSDGLTFKAGTSMAAPIVSGAAALVRQYFEEGWHVSGQPNAENGFIPRGSLVKAVLLNGAIELQGVQDDHTKAVSQSSAYDMNQGFGRINLLRSLPLAGKNDLKGKFVDSKTLSTGETDVHQIFISNDGCEQPLSVTLAWTDPPIGMMCEESCILNDLDVFMKSDASGTTYFPNGLSNADHKNNVERIRISNPKKGSSYTIRVSATQLIEPQAYSLAITGCLTEPSDDITPLPTGASSPAPTKAPTHSPTKQPVLLEPSVGSCADTTGVFQIGTGSRKCSWLESQSLSNVEFWCHWIDIAKTCPNTCKKCGEDFAFGGPQLTSPALDGTVRYFGNQFQLRPNIDITATSFDLHLYGSNNVDVEVWTRPSSANEWTQMCKSSVKSAGRYSTVTIPDGDCTPLKLGTGSLIDVYVTAVSSKDLIMIADGDWTLETEDLTLSNGVAVAYFDGSRSNGYGFDGSIRYSRGCSDNTSSTVRISDWAGDRTCAWLSQNMNRMDFSCEFTNVVLHCPLTCGYCQ